MIWGIGDVFEQIAHTAVKVTAEAVCADRTQGESAILPKDLWDLLLALRKHSLLQPEVRGGATRYHLLETVWQYAQEQLEVSSEHQAMRKRYFNWCLAFAQQAQTKLVGADLQKWLDRLEVERGNLRAAMAWCGEMAQRRRAGLCLAGALWRCWYVRGYLEEGRSTLERVMNPKKRTEVRTAPNAAKAYLGLGVLYWCQGDTEEARTNYERSIALCDSRANSRTVKAEALHYLGNYTVRRKQDLTEGDRLYKESLALYQELGDPRGQAEIINEFGNLALDAYVSSF